MSGNDDDAAWLEGWIDGRRTVGRAVATASTRSPSYDDGLIHGLHDGVVDAFDRRRGADARLRLNRSTEESRMKTRTFSRRAFAAAVVAGFAALVVAQSIGSSEAVASPPPPPPAWQHATLPLTIARMDRFDTEFNQVLANSGPTALKTYVLNRYLATPAAEKAFISQWVAERGLALAPDLIIDFVQATCLDCDEHLACESAAIALAEAAATPSVNFPNGSKSRVAALIPQAPNPRIAAKLSAAHAAIPN